MGQQAPEAGRVLNGRYRLEEKLGEGGMGQIWRAEHLILKAPVAVKLVDREAIPDDETLSRFIREAQAAAAIRSPHVVQILDYGTDDKIPFMVMELLDGETLAQRLRREKRLGSQDTSRIITHIARAVGRAHEEGIVHRDLKPENVFLVKNDDEELAKVLDFGVAKVESANLANEGTRTRTGSILGTPYYMSPEQAQGNKTVDFRSDLWSLAVIAFECLTGKRPFYSDGLGDLVLQICIRDIPVPSRVAPVPLGFDNWFRKGTEREPDKRFQSARELVESLRDALGIEGRETWAGPDVLITTGGQSDPPPSREPTSRSEAVTEIASPDVLPRPPGATPAPAEAVSAAPAESAEPPSAEAIPSGAATASPPPSRAATPTSRASNATESHDEFSAEALGKRFRGGARDDRVPPHTVRQFGTSKQSRPPPSRRSSSGVIWGVAGGALAIGAVIGFAVVSRGESGEIIESITPSGSFPNHPRIETATQARRADTPMLEPSASGSANAPIPPASASASASAVPLDTDAGPKAKGELDEEPIQDAGVELKDAGNDAWVKPDWARPDDEEEPGEVYPEQPPPAMPGPASKDNPY